MFAALAAANIAAVFTAWELLPLAVHLSIAGIFIVAALYLLTKNFFVKYNSQNDFIEIEQSGLFSDPDKPVKGHFSGYLKHRIQDFDVEKRWYGSKLILKYEELNGNIRTVESPFTFFSKRHVRVLSLDLKRILDTDINLFIGAGFQRPENPA